MSKESDLQGLHNQGQTDASNGKYDPPHSIIGGFVDFWIRPDDVHKQNEAENEAYNSGHANADKQK